MGWSGQIWPSDQLVVVRDRGDGRPLILPEASVKLGVSARQATRLHGDDMVETDGLGPPVGRASATAPLAEYLFQRTDRSICQE